ncbi:MAG: phosphatidate cytidylyltransferase [Roseovarius sp.]|nr:phosphatidate cytidylyltransferase [Roseovarius sp.]
MTANTRWFDLKTRTLSALVMAATGFGLLLAGGMALSVGMCIFCGLMAWELARMFGVRGVSWLAAMNAAALAVAIEFGGVFEQFGLILPLVFAVTVAAAMFASRDRMAAALFNGYLLLGCHSFVAIRQEGGFEMIIWLVCVVIASDVAGYFAGRFLGGPKFWPSISPSKTWFGTVAGWLVAATAGLLFGAVSGAGIELVAISAAVALAGQMGDIAESAIKRKASVKDSSALIPGHGGLLDRFDALLAASIMAFVLFKLTYLPQSMF